MTKMFFMLKRSDLALIKETMVHCVNEERVLPLNKFINFLFVSLIIFFFHLRVFRIPRFSYSIFSLGHFCTFSFHILFVTLDFYSKLFSDT